MGQVGDGAGYLYDAVKGPGRQAQLGGSGLEEVAGSLVQVADFPDFGRAHFRVAEEGGILKALGLERAGLLDPFPNHRRILGHSSVDQFFVFHRRHFHKNVNPIHQGAANALLVAGNGGGAANALFAGMGVVATGAGVLGGDEHKTGGVGNGAGYAADGNYLVLQGLAQGFQGGAVELRQLVEKEDAAVAHSDFAGAEVAAAADQAGVGDAVVGGAKGAVGNQGAVGGQSAADAVNFGGVEGFLGGHAGQDGGQGAGQHRFAAARRPVEQDVMETGGGHFQGALGVFLAFDVGKVSAVGRFAVFRYGYPAVGGRSQGGFAEEMADQGGQGRHGNDPDALDQGGLGSVGGGNIDYGKALIPGYGDHGQDAVGVAQAAVEGKLAEEKGGFGRQVDLAGAEQDADGDGEVVGRAGFFQVGGGQVDGDAAHREFAAAVAEGGAHPFPGFLDRRIGQADNVESGQAGSYVHFHLNDEPVQADYGAGLTFG